MKFFISYFWNVRNINPNAICLSTAKWDPHWFYNGKQGNVYRDRRGVMNGLRAEPFVPNCEYSDRFIEDYKKQLDALDFDNMMNRFKSIAERVSPNEPDPEIVLLVHEAPDNPVSERFPLFEWFAEHGIQAQEYPVPDKKSVKPKRQVYNF